jgi:hypothetical protein
MTIDRDTKDQTIYIDFKSKALVDVLRPIFKDVKAASLEGENPKVWSTSYHVCSLDYHLPELCQIERNLLYHFVPEMHALQDTECKPENCSPWKEHLNLLVQYLEDSYKAITDQLRSLLQYQKITWDLLWTCFKPGMPVYTTCQGTGQPRCIKFNFGEEKKSTEGVIYYEINGHYFDFDGKIFGEASETLMIPKFRGAKRIESLSCFPLAYHSDEQIRQQLIENGQKFVSLMGSHHRSYQGNAFFVDDDNLVRFPVNGRIMVDPDLLRKTIPNYPRLATKKIEIFDIFGRLTESQSTARVKSNDMNLDEIADDDFLICSPTVLGFSLSDKIWGK